MPGCHQLRKGMLKQWLGLCTCWQWVVGRDLFLYSSASGDKLAGLRRWYCSLPPRKGKPWISKEDTVSHNWVKVTWWRWMPCISFPNPWPGHSSTHLESSCIAKVFYLSSAFLVSQRIAKGDLKLLPFAYLLLGRHYSCLKQKLPKIMLL